MHLLRAQLAPRKDLLKQLQSADRERALEGARNSSRDITHLSDFVNRVNEAAAASSPAWTTTSTTLLEACLTLARMAFSNTTSSKN